MPPDPAEFDDRLRQVPYPAHLRERLHAIPQWADSDLDAQLAAVDLPSGLLTRLHAEVDDYLLDDALRSVPLSHIALARARIVADTPRSPAWLRNPVAQWAVAGSLILLVWSGYLGAIATFAVSSMPRVMPRQIVWIDQSTLELSGSQPESRVEVAEISWHISAPSPLVEHEIPVALEPEMPAQWISSTSKLHPLAEMSALYQRWGTSLPASSFRLHWDWLRGASPAAQERAAWELAVVTSSSSPAALWQAGTAQPHLFMLDNAPVFAPASDRRLETSRPTLSQRTTTFNWAQAMVANGRFPAGESLEVADFLAAMDYNSLQVAPNQVEWEVNVASSASGFTQAGVHPLVVQVGLQAGPALWDGAAPCDLQLAVDTSQSMGAGHLQAVKLALARLHANLGETHSLSLLSFAEEPQRASDWLTSADATLWHQQLTTLSARGTEDLGLGLHAALEHALLRESSQATVRRPLVLITDTDFRPTPPQQLALQRLATLAAAARIPLHFVHLGSTGEARQLLDQLAKTSGGTSVAARDAFEIYRAVAAILHDRNPMLARNISLALRFDPKQVAAYRLLGDHAPTIVASQQTASQELAAGESALALYEIWLRPDASGQALTVSARWTNVLNKKPGTRQQSFSVADLAAASAESPQTLWLASLALATAESLKPRGTEADIRDRIDQVLQVARSGSPAMVDRADSMRLIGLLEGARRTLEASPRPRSESPSTEPYPYNRSVGDTN